jgi:redox-regulated HSP33 family molecular chaperone
MVCPQGRWQTHIGQNQDQVRHWMVKALRQWLESHQLPAIIAGVLGVIIVLAVLLVGGGYLLVTP